MPITAQKGGARWLKIGENDRIEPRKRAEPQNLPSKPQQRLYEMNDLVPITSRYELGKIPTAEHGLLKGLWIVGVMA